MLQSSLAFAFVVSVALTASVALQWWTIAAALGTALLSAVLLVAADANRQVRRVRRHLQRVGQRVDRARMTQAPAMNTPDSDTPVQTGRADMLGAVRVLQAQYTARLDHLQAVLDDAIAEIRQDRDRGASDGATR